MAQEALDGGAKIAAAYGKPALESTSAAATQVCVTWFPPYDLKALGFARWFTNRRNDQAAGWATENPGSAATTALVAVGIAAPGVLSAPLLSALGFGAGGVQASSLAAGVHSLLGNVAAGSTFATLQSAGAGGAGLAALNGAAQVGAATVGVGNAAVGWARARL
ncbi:hypothetical protein P170DRAFT_479018 [Aspergillus steynii IBT 23096]|uniref:Uncharacterized protein n=1 Tax=Aspergillus steynii IBT 23096 TaxID=1392250 RepID=A0A2I2FZN8_9EURO|nr:uncharacterized protein P170DRAFT_479018 [Aspergillus steynii IBT 23096]PLB46099.1 hypothetical protein P170DRAFT_479018 [Aspergillus steynii IBT 23096]